MTRCHLQEVFSSVQGEGPYVGCRQIFIRLAGCNWHCNFCDTPDNARPASFSIEKSPGQRDFMNLTNPVNAEKLASLIKGYYDLKTHHSISLTGGEPLLQTDYLIKLSPLLAGTRQGIYLETNGTLPDKLREIIDLVAMVSMDIKLESSTGTTTPWELHHRFLQVAAQKKVYVKIVITSATSSVEIKKAAELISSVNPAIELVLQPVTPKGGCGLPTAEQVLHWQSVALDYLTNVRVIPQTHLMLGQL